MSGDSQISDAPDDEIQKILGGLLSRISDSPLLRHVGLVMVVAGKGRGLAIGGNLKPSLMKSMLKAALSGMQEESPAPSFSPVVFSSPPTDLPPR